MQVIISRPYRQNIIIKMFLEFLVIFSLFWLNVFDKFPVNNEPLHMSQKFNGGESNIEMNRNAVEHLTVLGS